MKNPRLLLVDDSAEFRQLVIAYLKNYPFDVVEADDGPTALEKMKGEEFDVVLMDYKMPLMDGATTTKLFREWESQVGSRHLMIIALSAFTTKIDQSDFFSAGCDDFLNKPINRSDLVKALNLALAKN